VLAASCPGVPFFPAAGAFLPTSVGLPSVMSTTLLMVCLSADSCGLRSAVWNPELRRLARELLLRVETSSLVRMMNAAGRDWLLKVEYMEPFVQAVRSVLEQVSGGRAQAGPLSLLGTTFPTACTNIAVRVNGSLEGDVVYSMSSLTAQKLAGLLVGAETYGFGRLTGSGLIQLGNMLVQQTGRFLIERGIKCDVSSPTVFQGLNVEFSVTAPALAVSVDTEAGQVDINVAVRNGKQS